ncbi:MAG: site-specific integrase [Microgenomates group bacterium]
MQSIILSNVFDYQALLDNEFSTYLIKQNASEVTRKNYLADIRNFFKWLNICITNGSITLRENAEKPLTRITNEIIETFKRSLITSQTPIATINRRLSALRMFFQFANLEQKITENPMMLVRNIPRTDAPNEANILDMALDAYAKKKNTKPTDIDDIKTFFSWYYKQYIS